MSGPKRTIEPADEERNKNEQRQPDDCRVVLCRCVRSGERKICADGEGKRSGNQTGLPSAIPRAHHNRDSEYGEAAFRNVGQ